MSCDCPTAPMLSGPGSDNLTKLPSEAVIYSIEWCPRIASGAVVSDEGWTVLPSTTTAPLVVSAQTSVGTITSAQISGGTPGQLYMVQDQIAAQVGAGPIATISFTLWVYIPLDNSPAVFVPCEENT